MRRIFYYNASKAPSGGGYILDEISSTPVYAVSFARYLTANWVGQPVVRLRMSSNGNQEFDLTPDDLTNGTAVGLSNGGHGFISRIYSHVNGTYFNDIFGGRQHLMIANGQLMTDSKGNPALEGKNGLFGRYAMSPLPYTGSNCAAFNVGKCHSNDLGGDPYGSAYKTGSIGRWNPYPTSNPRYFILGLGYKIVQNTTPLPFTSAYANGTDISGGSNDMLSYNGVETISNMTGVNLTGSSVWTDESGSFRVELWPNTFTDATHESRQVEQIFFNDLLEKDRQKIETDQNNFYGYF